MTNYIDVHTTEDFAVVKIALDLMKMEFGVSSFGNRENNIQFRFVIDTKGNPMNEGYILHRLCDMIRSKDEFKHRIENLLEEYEYFFEIDPDVEMSEEEKELMGKEITELEMQKYVLPRFEEL
jgi:hypothetical protein